MGALLVDYSPSTMQLPFIIWCINSVIHIIYSKEGRVLFVDCWRNKNPIILNAFSKNSNVSNFMVVYSNIKVWQKVDQFLTTYMIDAQS